MKEALLRQGPRDLDSRKSVAICELLSLTYHLFIHSFIQHVPVGPQQCACVILTQQVLWQKNQELVTPLMEVIVKVRRHQTFSVKG